MFNGMSGYEQTVAFSQSSAAPGWFPIQSSPGNARQSIYPLFKITKLIKTVHLVLPLTFSKVVGHPQEQSSGASLSTGWRSVENSWTPEQKHKHRSLNKKEVVY